MVKVNTKVAISWINELVFTVSLPYLYVWGIGISIIFRRLTDDART